jgi:hypothetical protein
MSLLPHRTLDEDQAAVCVVDHNYRQQAKDKNKDPRGFFMSMVRVTPEIHNSIRTALKNPFQFERTERFAMQQVLCAPEVEQVFLDEAREALLRHRPPGQGTRGTPAQPVA